MSDDMREGVHWGRVMIGLAVLVGMHVLGYVAAGDAFFTLVERDPPMAFALA